VGSDGSQGEAGTGGVLARLVPARLCGAHGVLLLIQAGWFARFILYPGVDAPRLDGRGVAEIAFSFATLLAWFQVLHAALSGSRALRAAVLPAVFFAYQVLLGLHFRTYSPLDYAVTAVNWREALHPEALGVVVANLGGGMIAFAAGVTALIVLIDARTGAVSRCAQRRPLLPKTAVALGLYGALLAVPLTSWDELTHFLRTVREYYQPGSAYNVALGPKEFPLLATAPPTTSPLPPGARRPDVYLLMLESVNAGFVGTRTADGREYTPVLNALLGRGLSVERFYGNSIQTCKGQFATLLSLVPSTAGKEYYRFLDTRFHSLPALLAEHGYDTVYFQAHRDLAYDGTGPFLGRNGFAELHSVVEYLDPREREAHAGWGVPDELFYRGFFTFLDDHRRRSDAGRPLFVTLAPVFNHEDWSHLAPEEQELYRPARTWRERYANSLHLSDRALGGFVAGLERRGLLRDAVLVIVGDHGYPMNEHGIQYNQSGFYEESFRTPFLLIHDGAVAPERVRGVAASQLDIAPTIADAVGIGGYRSHFQGVSLLARPRPHRPIPMVQPYSGRYLEIYERPWKFIRHLRDGREYLFDLEADPGERRNLAGDPARAGDLDRLRGRLGVFFLTERACEENRVWPGGGASP